MIDKKLFEQAKELWINVNIEILKERWLPAEVINDILEIEIDKKLWKDKTYTLEEVKDKFNNKFSSNVVECIN